MSGKKIKPITIKSYINPLIVTTTGRELLSSDNSTNNIINFPNTSEQEQPSMEVSQIDQKLLEIVIELESDGILDKPVKFQTPEELKQLGETMFLVNTSIGAQRIINDEKIFACTWSELKQLAQFAKDKNTFAIQSLIVKLAFNAIRTFP